MHTANVKNRGYYKIEGAARAFNFDFRNKTILDIGSSTGGFTQYALDHGAKKVIAVEKGTNQMASPLRHDPRIDLHEKTDIFDAMSEGGNTRIELRGAFATTGANDEASPVTTAPWDADDPTGSTGASEEATRSSVLVLQIPDVIVADVSFLSLKKALSHAKKHLSDPHTEFLVMLKPQFEAHPDQLVKGVVKNEKIRREIIKNFESWLKTNNFVILKKHDNELHGKTGNKERFYLLKSIK